MNEGRHESPASYAIGLAILGAATALTITRRRRRQPGFEQLMAARRRNFEQRGCNAWRNSSDCTESTNCHRRKL